MAIFFHDHGTSFDLRRASETHTTGDVFEFAGKALQLPADIDGIACDTINAFKDVNAQVREGAAIALPEMLCQETGIRKTLAINILGACLEDESDAVRRHVGSGLVNVA